MPITTLNPNLLGTDSAGASKLSTTGGLVQLHSTGVFAIANNTANNFAVANSGFVGIGTVSPTQKLQVESSANLSIQLTKTGVASFVITNNGTDGTELAVESTPMIFKSSSTERMRITANGSIGFGVTDPNTTIDTSRAIIGNRLPNANGASMWFSGGRTTGGVSASGTLLTVEFIRGGYTAATVHLFWSAYALNGGSPNVSSSGMIGGYEIINLLHEKGNVNNYNITRVAGPQLSPGLACSFSTAGSFNSSNTFTLTASATTGGQSGFTFTGYMVTGGQSSDYRSIILTTYDGGTTTAYGT